ncbi:MAG: hypothetical protein RLZZ73_339, partial [Actinomycetota bacterium]
MSFEAESFIGRHIGPNSSNVQVMLTELGYTDLSAFTADVVPESIAMAQRLEDLLPAPQSEVEVINLLRSIAAQNKTTTSLIGCGYYNTVTPAVIKRNVLENPAWYTAYTPYQPEISQGRLEALFAFQTVITDLTGLAISNASMLDEATAAAEAMTLAKRIYKGSDAAIFAIDINVHPQTKAVVQTRAKPLGITVREFDTQVDGVLDNLDIFGVLIQYPDTYGAIHDYSDLTNKMHSKDALVIAATDLLALTLLKPPGEWGADIAVGSAQRFGVPMGFGGPHAGFMAVRDGLERSLPGRLIGQSVDAHGNPAFRLALQTREQHIRRDKATSNICTAQVLLANMSAFYAMWHGPQGLIDIATRVGSFTYALSTSGVKVISQNFFDTVVIEVKGSDAVLSKAVAAGFNLRKIDN